MEISSSLRRIIQAVALLMVTTFVGIVGYILIEGYELLDAVYMTVITMSTVGFGTVRELSAGGKVFSVFLIIISASTFVYAITTITTFVVEGEIQQVFNRYKVSKSVASLSDHIIICGLGRNGREAAVELLRQNRPFVVIEKNPSVIEEFITEVHEILVITGDATHEEILDKANINKAKGLISSLSTDAENVYIALTAREMHPKLEIVARASHESSITKLKRAGANKVIVPNLIGGRKMANMITRPSLVEFVEMVSGEGNPDLHLEEVFCANHPSLQGKNLAELQIRSRTGVLVLGKKHGDRQVELNPRADVPLVSDDRLFVLGTDQQLDRFRKAFLEE